VTKEIIGMSAIVAIGCIGAWNADAADWTVSGFVRQEIAAKISDDSNMNNGAGNPFNGVAEPYTGLGPTPATFQPRPASAKINNTFNQFSTPRDRLAGVVWLLMRYSSAPSFRPRSTSSCSP